MLRPAALSLLLLFTGVSSATAACVIVPDGPQSRYVENLAAYTLCQQREVAAAADLAATRARMEAELRRLRADLERQQLLQRQLLSTFR